MTAVQKFLEHYGTKGMKWGVRKSTSAPKSGSSSGERTVYTKPAGKLTDAELAKRIKRLESEKRYTELNSATTSKGKTVADEIIANSTRKVATTLISGTAIALGAKYVEKKFGVRIKTGK